MHTSQVNPRNLCPACLSPLDGAADPEGTRTPTEGDLSICIYCSGVSAYKKDLTLRSLHENEFSKLDPTTKASLTRYRSVIQERILQRNIEARHLMGERVWDMVNNPGRYLVTIPEMHKIGLATFVEVTPEGLVYQLTPSKARDGLLSPDKWHKDTIVGKCIQPKEKS